MGISRAVFGLLDPYAHSTICPNKEAEIEWLHSKIYRYEKDIPTQEVTAINRYSSRLWDF